MKRPLFWVCVALSFIAVLWLFLSGATDRRGLAKRLFSGNPPWEDCKIEFYGRVCGKEIRGDKEYFLLTDLSSHQVQNAAASRQIISMMQQMKTDRIQCQMAGEPGNTLPKMGSMVLVIGDFALFSESTNPGEFNTAEYYQGKRIGGKLTDVYVLSESEKYRPLEEALYNLKAYFGRRLDSVFPQREAGTMRTLLLGDRSYLDKDLKEIYQAGGIVHILSISGLHVSLLGMGLYELLRKIGVRGSVACVLASAVLLLYGMMTGFGVSSCRAIGMFLLRMLSLLWGRTYDLLTALGVMAAGMLCLIPVYGVNSGFWLSFASLLGVGGLLPIWEKLARGRKKVRFGTGLRAGCSVFLATLPLTLLYYFEVPTYSMLLNLIVVPAMGPVIFFGMVAMLVPGLGILGTVDVVLLRIFERMCLFVRDLPYSSWNPGCPKPWQMVVYYLGLGGILWMLWRLGRDGERHWSMGVPSWNWLEKVFASLKGMRRFVLRFGWLTCFLPMLIFLVPVHRMTGVVFLDVGQGDCVILRLENGQTWISDCGSSNRTEIGENVLIPYLKHEGIRRIDGVFLSHEDEDHTNGIKELFEMAGQEEIRIDCLYLPQIQQENADGKRVVAGGEAQIQQENADRKKVVAGGEAHLESTAETGFSEILIAAGNIKGLRLQELRAGDELRGDQITFLILHPEGNAKLDSNQNSLCMLVRFISDKGERTVLLTGDVEGEGEEELLKAMEAHRIHQVDILKCAHHGSKNATSQAFLDMIDAQACVISCGRHNRYGHPHQETLERLQEEGCSIYRTDADGAVIIRIRGAK